jgi:monoamine oxidase
LSERRRLSTAEFEALMDMYAAFPDALEALREVLGPTASAAEGIDRFVAESGLDGGEGRRARLVLRLFVAAEAADTPERQSLRWLWNEADYDGDQLGDVPVGGYERLIGALAQGVPVRLGAEVTRIDVSVTGVQVTTKDGAVESCSHVVVTVPLGVLKHGSIRFTPALPEDRRAAIDRLGFGSFEKIALTFHSPFWRDASVPHLLAFPRDDASLPIVGQDAFGGGPALVGLVFGDSCRHVVGRSADTAVDWMLDVISEAITRPCPEPTAIAVSSWTSDPYSRGAYTHNTPEGSPADVHLLGQPLHGRLLFAGEATTTTRMGFADGAFQTGIREAKRLLGQPTITLGANGHTLNGRA